MPGPILRHHSFAPVAVAFHNSTRWWSWVPAFARDDAGSKHLMHVELDAVGVPGADTDKQVLHQPAVFFTARFEFRHRTKIDQLGIDGLALGDPVQKLLRTETDAD